jgi:hypothetical protein
VYTRYYNNRRDDELVHGTFLLGNPCNNRPARALKVDKRCSMPDPAVHGTHLANSSLATLLSTIDA